MTSVSASTSLTADSLTLGSYGMATAGVLTIASMGGNWTNASRTVADLGTITTVDINGGTIDGATVGATTQAAVKATTLSASSTLSVGDDSTFAGKLEPLVDNGFDLGSSTKEWKNLYLDGIAYIDELRADTLGAALDCNNQALTNVDVDSGAIDGTTIGANSVAAGSFAALVGTTATFSSTLTANGDTVLGNAAGDTIGFTGSVGSNFIPDVDSAHDLGSSAKRWSTIYVDSIVGADVAFDVETRAAGQTISAGTDFALITSGDGGTVTMPAASAGKAVRVKLSASVGDLILAAASGDTIENAANVRLESTGSAVTLVAVDAQGWFII